MENNTSIIKKINESELLLEGETLLQTAKELTEYIKNVNEQGFLLLAKLLFKIKNEKLYLDIEYKNFKEYLENDLGISFRKGYYLYRIYANLIKQGLPDDKIKEIEKLGLTKLVYLTKYNVNISDSIIKQLEPVTISEAEVKIKQIADKIDNEVDIEKEKSYYLSLKLNKEQYDIINTALEQVKKTASNNTLGSLMTAIALNYLSDKDTAGGLINVEGKKYVIFSNDLQEILESNVSHEELVNIVAMNTQSDNNTIENQESEQEEVIF